MGEKGKGKETEKLNVVDVLSVEEQIILNWQRQPWEGDQEGVNRSGTEEPMWVAIHKCMEAMLGISLYSYCYLKLVKMLCLSFYFLCFLFNKIGERAEQVLHRKGEGGGAGGGPKQYIHM
jgi:hypothetical protein